MKIEVLGGGNEIGASCFYLEMNGTAVLIDAGMRMNQDNAMPALGMLEGKKKPEAVLVTHAHADHIGALPVVHSLYPDIPIFASPPTADLMRVMMQDSYKILQQQTALGDTLMPYTEEEMRAMLDEVRLLPASGHLRLGKINVQVFSAGHILGAVMFLFEGGGERVLFTGDLSFRGGRTIPGARIPQRIQPDVIVMESTYGNRLHTDRNIEEKRLAENVARVIAAGGKVLIPAFALGRAQEVLIVLQDYMEKGLIPTFPIFVDGLVTPISKIYRSYPQFLKGPLAYRIRKNGDAFFNDERCRAVTPEERKEVVDGRPCCIVASSGMLTGGASAWYAEKLLTDEKNAIMMTGYQDEESPGRKLLALAKGEENKLELNGTVYDVACQVDQYGLSAHADAREMTRLIETLAPTYTLLVHGDEEARQSLARSIHSRYHPELVENGESYSFEKRSSQRGVRGKRFRIDPELQHLRDYIGRIVLYRKEEDEAVQFAICLNVHPKTGILTLENAKGKSLKVSSAQIVGDAGKYNRPMEHFYEAARAVEKFSRPYFQHIDWFRVPARPLSVEEVFRFLGLNEEQLAERLAVSLALAMLPDHVKKKDRNGRTGFLLDAQTKRQLEQWAIAIPGLEMDPASTLEEVRRLMANHPRFLRCGMQGEEVVVSFDFPDAVKEKERKKIADAIFQATGRKTRFSPSVRQDAFQPIIEKLLGHTVETPSIYLADRRIELKEKAPPEKLQIQQEFHNTTGFTLIFQDDSEDNLREAFTGRLDEEGLFLPKENVEPLEKNKAISVARQWAESLGVSLYKVGVKEKAGRSILELHFITPQVASRYQKEMQKLAQKTGMAVTYTRQPKQNELIRLIRTHTPQSWHVKGNPSIRAAEGRIDLTVYGAVPEQEKSALKALITEQSGYDLFIFEK